MCGIFGYIGPRDSTEICLSGLKVLEYRGYDSAGIAGFHKGNLLVRKEIGPISVLEKVCKENPFHLNLAIAHTRWATHGQATKENAHPHFDSDLSVAVVHNGVIENHFELKEELEKLGYSFYSDTDSEVIAQLIAHEYEGDIFRAVAKSLKKLRGMWGIAVIHKLHPDTIIVAAKDCPLAIAWDKEEKEAFIASDTSAFQEGNLEVIFLTSGEMAIVTSKGYTLFNSQEETIEKISQKLATNRQMISKNGYEHFMLKEICEQPFTLHQAFSKRLDKENESAFFEELKLDPLYLKNIDRIVLLGCGTAWHASLLGALMIEEKIQIPAQAEIASEFRSRLFALSPNTLVIVTSQSGETADSLAAMREAKKRGAKVLGICNVTGSTLAREADSCLFLKAGPEISVCSTKAFTSQLVVLLLFTLFLGRLKHTISHQAGVQLLTDLEALPDLVSLLLSERHKITPVAKKFASFKTFFFLGRNTMYTTAQESALKLKEISYLNANAYPAGELKHGPIALVDDHIAAVAFLGHRATLEKTISNLLEVQARKGQILIFAPENTPSLEKITPHIISVPPISDTLAPILYSIAGQLFAYDIALELGTEIDKPRNLAKSVTVE